LKIIIIANGSFNNPDFYRQQIEEDDYIICADGGAKYAVIMGVTPHLVVGDLDSIEKDVFEGLKDSYTRFIKYPSEKDESDLELALLKAISLKPDQIIIWGALGKRIDHLFANLMLLTIPLKHSIKTKLVDEDHEIYVIDKELELTGAKGDYLSLFPLSKEVKGITTQGLKYKLNRETLYLGPTRGLSNEFIVKTPKVTFQEGLLLVIHVRRCPGFTTLS
jgi:thiamine pyrophosphokinase